MGLRAGEAACNAIVNGLANGKTNTDQKQLEKVNMVVLSPGPGSPSDFKLSDTLKACEEANVGVFGVCLGMQGMVEHFGGKLDILSYPMHGKPSTVTLAKNNELWVKQESHTNKKEESKDEKSKSTILKSSPEDVEKLKEENGYGGYLFTDLPKTFEVAQYHSLHGPLESLPKCLKATAMTEDNIVMAIQHETKPFAAVQFHPESILTNPIHGLRIISNAIEFLSK